jgi:anti-sigma28 factor (negative regulator of flagellin synthesis)
MAKYLNRRTKTEMDEKSSAPFEFEAPSNGTGFNAVKVARLMQDIAAGRYQINPEVIADKLIAQAPSVLPGTITH